ncbi:hypothetical protein [Okeania sp. KiyG1]|nr:hypothetical protein [Okeania sp. KiyG1]
MIWQKEEGRRKKEGGRRKEALVIWDRAKVRKIWHCLSFKLLICQIE